MQGFVGQTNLLSRIAARGSMGGVSSLKLAGVNGGITTSLETIWPNTSAYTFLQVNMTTPTVSSGSANDTAAGTGARTVRVTGVDQNYTTQSEIVTLNGQTGVSLVNSYMVINAIEVLTVGSGLVNAGIIYVGTGAVTSGVPAVVHGIVSAGESTAKSFIYAVPLDKILLIKSLYAASRSTTAGGHEIKIVSKDSVAVGPFKTSYINGFTNTAPLYHRNIKPELAFPGGTQLQAQVLATAGTGPLYAFADCLLVTKSDHHFL